MSVEAASAQTAQFETAYVDYDRKLRSRRLIIANWISIIGMASGVGLDYVLYPAVIREFFLTRLVVDLILLVFIGVLVFGRERLGTLALQILGIASTLVVAFSFNFMIFFTEGARSPYAMALILIIMSMSVMLPWVVWETATTCGLALLSYIVACALNSDIAAPGAWGLFAYNTFFVLITSVVCVTITYFLARARREDFQLRHQLDAQNRELQDLDRLKTQFFSNISHELRTPLTLILSPVETLLSHGDMLDAKVHERLILVHRNTLRLLKLINDLLDLTRLDQGVQMLRKRNIVMGSFVKGMVESVRHLGLQKQLRMRVEEGDESLEMVADPSRIEKVLVNLLTNAIKYTPAGGNITVRWSGDETTRRIEVADTGVGIPAEDLPKVFDRFHQVRSNAANQNQGVGIGLALAKELVDEHGGMLTAESEIGAGSTFSIILPLAEAAPDEELSPIAEATIEAEEPFEKAFRSADRSWRSYNETLDINLPIVGQGQEAILVADDENDMRRYIVSLLSDEYRVVQTQHGENVADLVAEHEPGIVLLDWMMPGKDGLTVCRELRADERNRDLKIVLLTARIDEKSKLAALGAGADDFLTKPFSSAEVRTRLSNLQRVARLQKDLRVRNAELSAALEKLQRTERMLIQSEKMNAIGSLSAGLLHEINNPLNYTLTAISFAKQFKDSLSEEMKEIVADIEEGMIRIRDVITHLKNFAYPEKAGAESVFSLDEVFLGARKIVAKEIEGIQVEADFPEGFMVKGQKTQLTHLFINLLNNAAKAMNGKPTGRPKAIMIRGEIQGDRASIEVADTGPGIPEDIINRIFEPFFTTRDVGEGMGLGLSICHTIMEAHGGSIQVKNRPEGGALFTIDLPLTEEALKLC